MINTRSSLKIWFENLMMRFLFQKYRLIHAGTIQVDDFEADGPILDIGGGGEGVIGRLKGSQVIAIDLHQEELDEAPDGPQKVVMDARHLDFPDDHFAAATAFFSFMYMKTRQDHQEVLKETWRTLKPGGRLYFWDVDLSDVDKGKKEAYLVRLHYRVADFSKGTGYAARWPQEVRDEAYYSGLAAQAGFQIRREESLAPILRLVCVKEPPARAEPLGRA